METSLYIPLATLVKIARHIERVKGVKLPGTVDQVHAEPINAAGTAMTFDQATRNIADIVFTHPINGDYPATDSAIMEIAQKLEA